MTPLNELLDEIGWAAMPEEGRKFCWAMFRWAQQATLEIDRLRGELDRVRDRVYEESV